MIWIDAETVAKSYPVSECIETMEDLYRNEGTTQISQPSRSVLKVDDDSVILTMQGYSPRLRRFGVKLVTEYKSNPKKYSLPVQGGTLILLDTENSTVLANVDAPAITAIRTGAVSGLATKYLAKSECEKLGLIGTGQQARTMLKAVLSVRKGIKIVQVYSRNRENVERFSKEMTQEIGLNIEGVSSNEAVLKEVDIINVATNSATPVLRWKDVPRGAHINSIGTLAERTELDLDTVSNSTLFVDTRNGVLKDAGDVISAIGSGRITKDKIKGDLSDLVNRKVSGREDDSEVTLFKSVGTALQDVYASSWIYEKISKS
ncbi:MAG: ornithine cyclodeaminase family protein [Thaumarchaeota archaeon]|nr:ornithine cyclodeaminase family protein [Nitrososphaerota archaeon]